MMVLVSWLLTILFSSPQVDILKMRNLENSLSQIFLKAIIFRVLKHPTKEFYQCTTINFFEVRENKETSC